MSQACSPVSWHGFVPLPDVGFQVFKKAKRQGKKNGVGGFFGILLSNPKKTSRQKSVLPTRMNS